jgi:predicted acylesterase/phospholipase RssA
MGRTRALAALLFVLLLAAGCLCSRHYPAPNVPSSAQLVPIDSQSEPTQPGRTTTGVALQPRPRSILAISGGGLYGAYAVGVLKGWSESGHRPTFEVVTGISTGALIAPLAFLGSDYDDYLETWYTTLKSHDIFRRRSVPAILWSDSLAKSAPLRKRVEAFVTPEFLERIAALHSAGRRLYIGTTDLDTQRLVVWDMGAIAAGDATNKLALFRNVIVASCSIPGLLPPVPIDVEVNGSRRTELHVDGGMSASVFIPPCVFPDSVVPESDVYVLVSGKVASGGHAVPRGVLSVTQAGLGGLLLSQCHADLRQIYLQAHRSGASFRFAAVPEEFDTARTSMDIDPAFMTRLWEEGRRFAASGFPWRTSPPGLHAHDQPPPRTGTRLLRIEPAERPPANDAGRRSENGFGAETSTEP